MANQGAFDFDRTEEREETTDRSVCPECGDSIVYSSGPSTAPWKHFCANGHRWPATPPLGLAPKPAPAPKPTPIDHSDGGNSETANGPELFRPSDSGQVLLLDSRQTWEIEWVGMPEFIQDDLAPESSLTVHFASRADRAAFARLVEQNLTPRTKSIWYPEAEITRFVNKRYIAQ